MAVSRPSDLVGGGGLRAGSGARPTAGAKGKYVSKGTGKTGSNAVKKAKSATKKAAQNSTKVKSNALQKSKTRAKTKGRYDEYRVMQHPGDKETIDYKTGRTNKKPKIGMPVSNGVFSLPKDRKK